MIIGNSPASHPKRRNGFAWISFVLHKATSIEQTVVMICKTNLLTFTFTYPHDGKERMRLEGEKKLKIEKITVIKKKEVKGK